MANIIDYVQTNMSDMLQKPFCPADSLVLSKLCYVRFNDIVPGVSKLSQGVRIGEILRAEMFGSMFKYMSDTKQEREFLFALAASPRYRNIRMNYYVDKYDKQTVKQFAAVTFLLEDGTAYIAFRGTDTTLTGWKEDFNMAFTSPIPSQEESVEYLNKVSKLLKRPVKIRVGGHSKGGNLAVYSAIKCSPKVQKRIISVFNHDGPGFKDNLFETPQFKKIKELMHTTLPEASLIGMLLQHHENYKVVKSSSYGIMQHDPFSWEIKGDDFVYAGGLKASAVSRNAALNQWLSGLEDEKRKRIVDVFFSILEKTKASTFQEMSASWSKSVSAVIAAISDMDAESKKFVSKTITELAKISVRNAFLK